MAFKINLPSLKIRVIFLLLYAGVCIPVLHAQTSIIRGSINDLHTGQALDLANVTLQKLAGNEEQGTISDRNGFYQFNDVETGKYLFMVRYVGYNTYTDTLTISSTPQTLVKHVNLEPNYEQLDELIIADTQRDDLSPGQLNITPEDFKRTPTPAGSADLVSYIQTQPGVVSTGDRGGQLFVRGGTPSENLILMDGTLIYQPFHIIGFFSVFPEDVISKVDFYAGGFGARFSGRTSSVMDVRLKNGSLYERNWSASLSPFLSELYFESPVKDGESSILVSIRGSLIEESSNWYLNEKQPLRFNSQLVKYNATSGEGLNCSALFLRTYDRGQLDFADGDFFKWSNIVSGGRCAGVSEGSGISYMDMNFGLSYYTNETGNRDFAGRNSSIFRSHIDLNFAFYLGDLRLDYGIFTNYRTIAYDISDRFVSIQQNEESFLTTGGYASLNIPLSERISLAPGVSYTSYLNRFQSSFEPRLQVSWQPRGRADEEIHAAVGIYRQPLMGITDYRDAGTAFVAWMPSPDPDRRMKALHTLLGWRQPMGRFLKFSAEGYYKELYDTPVSTWSTTAQFSTKLAYADGNVHGVDIRLDFNQKLFYLGVGYGYSITEYKTAQEHFGTWFGEPIQKYHPPHDRRHQVNIQAGFEIGNFSTMFSWIYGSGLPYTRPMGFDSYFSFEKRPPDVTEGYGQPRVLLDKPFQGKLPDFHRLDVSVEQAFLLPTVKINVQAGAINTYNWNNLFYYDVFDQKGVDQLPLMPYLSLKIESHSK